MNARHSIETPRGVAGAIAMIRVDADEIGPLMILLGIGDLPVGAIRLCGLLGIDSGVVARWSAGSVMLMPHGGPAIVRAISEKLTGLGVPIEPAQSGAYPEASNEIEARMLATLAAAPSPLAIDLLLDQPRRWREEHRGFADAAVLGHLLDPPIVVAVGRANIGKSSLLNAIAGTRVVLVADRAGTTRDHVGVAVDLAGLVVHWVDTPGVDERVADDDAVVIAVEMVRRAALVVHCIDAGEPPGALDDRVCSAIGDRVPVVEVLTRGDRIRGERGGLSTSAATGDGLEGLVRAVRERLVPSAVLCDGRRWRFWTD